MTTNASEGASAPGELRRDLGLADATAIGLGAIIGAGVFVVTGVAAGVAGPAFLVGFFIAGLAALANALSSAQLAATYPQSGGTYEYGYRVLHPWAGYIAGWMFLASKMSAAGAVALGFSGYLNVLVAGLPPRWVAVGAVLLFTLVNYFGVRRSSRLNLTIVAITILALLVFILAGVTSFQAENFQPFAPNGVGGVMQAAALLFFAYTGYARIATLGEEVHEPERTIPRAILLALGGAAFLYFAVGLVAVGSVGAANLSGTTAPLAVAARALPLPGLQGVVAVGAVTAMLGVLLSQLLGLSRMAFAMARRRDLPAFLAHIHPQHGVPDRAVVGIGLLVALLTAFGTLLGVVSVASFTILVYYGIANLAALRMPTERKLYPNLIPSFGFLACLVLAFSLSARTILEGCIVLVVGVVVRLVHMSWRSANSGR